MPVSALRGTFDRLQLRVSENDIFMNEMTINFSAGEPRKVPLRFLIRAGSKSRETLVPGILGRGRLIRSIELKYRTVPNFKGWAVVEVWGRSS